MRKLFKHLISPAFMRYKGCIIEESLTDNRVLNNIKTFKIRITSEDNPQKRWHIYDSIVSETQINYIHKYLKQGWYMHFWDKNKMIVLFKDKKFILDVNKADAWKNAIDYGLSIGIKKEQLDFEMEF